MKFTIEQNEEFKNGKIKYSICNIDSRKSIQDYSYSMDKF